MKLTILELRKLIVEAVNELANSDLAERKKRKKKKRKKTKSKKRGYLYPYGHSYHYDHDDSSNDYGDFGLDAGGDGGGGE